MKKARMDKHKFIILFPLQIPSQLLLAKHKTTACSQVTTTVPRIQSQLSTQNSRNRLCITKQFLNHISSDTQQILTNLLPFKTDIFSTLTNKFGWILQFRATSCIFDLKLLTPYCASSWNAHLKSLHVVISRFSTVIKKHTPLTVVMHCSEHCWSLNATNSFDST